MMEYTLDIAAEKTCLTMQELCDMKLLSQTRHTCFPPCVEYVLTEEGEKLVGILSRIPEALN